MSYSLANLSPSPGARKRRKRLGIGEGSGLGKTCGKGQKGQNSRSGGGTPRGFEGGQMPLYRRLPKVGFTSRKKVLGLNTFAVIALGKLVELVGKSEITREDLLAKGLVSKGKKYKILADGASPKNLVVETNAISSAARRAVEENGGEVRLIQ